MKYIPKIKEYIIENKSTVVFILIVLLTFVLLYYVLFINKRILTFLDKPQPLPEKTFHTVDPKLNTVLNSTDMKRAAEEQKLAVEGNTVKAVIILKDESFIFTQEYGKEVLRYGKHIQAIVKLDKLKTLAENPKIEKIEAPYKGK